MESEDFMLRKSEGKEVFKIINENGDVQQIVINTGDIEEQLHNQNLNYMEDRDENDQNNNFTDDDGQDRRYHESSQDYGVNYETNHSNIENHMQIHPYDEDEEECEPRRFSDHSEGMIEIDP